MTMDTSLVPYGNIVEGSRRSISHISSKDVIPKTSTDKVRTIKYLLYMCILYVTQSYQPLTIWFTWYEVAML